MTAGLPDDAPVDTVREDTVRKGLLFAGSENSVWMSFDDGDHWQSLQLNLLHTSTRDLWIHDNDLIVATHGRSLWIMDDITPLRQINAQVARSSAWLFKPAPAYRVRRDTNTDTPLPPDEPAGKNPPDGEVLDYLLGQLASGPVTIEILDAKSQSVRRYTSTEKPDISQNDLKTLSIPPYWVRMPQVVPTTAGIHRCVWDLHYASPKFLRHEYPIAAISNDTPRLPLGPRALPGLYTVRLTANGSTYTTAPLIVKMDPRVKTSQSRLQQHFDIETELASMSARSTEAIRRMHAVDKYKPWITNLDGRVLGLEVILLKQVIAALKSISVRCTFGNRPDAGLLRQMKVPRDVRPGASE
jgi:hypothetical protein